MPPKKSNIGRTTKNARTLSALRADETSGETEARLEAARIRASTSRTAETPAQREARLECQRVRTSTSRDTETPAEREARLKDLRVRASTSRDTETPVEREARLEDLRVRASTSRDAETPVEMEARLEDLRVRASTSRDAETPAERDARREIERLRQNQTRIRVNLNRAAFNYDNTVNYKMHSDIAIGPMSTLCPYCHALKFKKETPGMCCSNGKVNLPPLDEPPEPLLSYLAGSSRESKHFLQHIRKYNSCFQMTSFGASNIVRYGNGNFMPTFKVQGQVYHQIGSLLPIPEEDPQFLQIYFIDNIEEELDRRCAFSLAKNREIVAAIRALLNEHNRLVRDFKSALENPSTDDFKVIIRADKTPTNEHARRFNSQMAPEVAAVVVGTEITRRDIVISKRDGTKQRVSETHRSYDALQYPIMFPRGEDGYHLELYQINSGTGNATTKKVSCKDFYAYRIMIRDQQTNHLLMCRQLFQQFIVDMYAKVETERLNYIRFNQSKLRVEQYIHLRDAVANDRSATDVGHKVILPASYTGSPRHMHEYAQDAFTYVRKYGRPDLFITFTCNPSWTDITDLLLQGQQPCHRHDITARIFKQKLIRFMEIITKNHIFGQTRCWMYSVEWQKRGLPHAHILIWLVDKIVPAQIDETISAELPHPVEDPELFAIVKKNMIHGPCGVYNPNSPCMKDGKCTKNYPRAMVRETQTGGDGYPQYRRRSPEEGGCTATIRVNGIDFEIDNRWIVPYSPMLLKSFNAHINVEYCNSVKSIKYICKYVNKGSDMAVFGLENPNAPVDEIEQFQMGRYISSNEAVWRILGFDIHERFPAVVHLSVHLENGQRVYFTEENAAQRALEPQNTTLTAFFQLCATDNFAKTLLYPEVPRYYTWNPSTKMFHKRKRGVRHQTVDGIFLTDTLGRVYTVHPSNSECYYLRMLLHVVKGPTSFQDLKTVEGQVCHTFREACSKLGLLENDAHWDNTLAEASETRNAHQIRTLFAIILTACAPSNPQHLWERHKESMSEDILLRLRRANPDLEVQNSEDVFNEALISLEDICISINNKVLNEIGLRSPERNRNGVLDKELLQETQYNISELKVYVETHEERLTDDQKLAYDTVMHYAREGNGGLLFIDAPGGTGKTFLLNLLLAKIRMNKHVALAVASSGIAATLLDGGRTAHSAFKLPLNLNQAADYQCNISKTSGMATLLRTCQLIIWDECTMAHKKGLEALDYTLKDFKNNQRLMGGALVLLAGDFRQTLPVIPRSTPADELNACLKNSPLWRHVKKMTLSTNMRVHLLQDNSAEHFAKQLLDMGDGKLPLDPLTKEIEFPPNFCQMQSSLEDLEKNVFPDIAINFRDHEWLCERTILAPKNDDVNRINIKIQSKIPGVATEYKSIDTIVEEDQAVNYPTEFLNSLEPPGMPPHTLNLKVGSPILLLRNLNTPKLCNGTRLTVKRLMPNLIEAKILNGKCKGEDVLIPRIPMFSTDLPFNFKRLQFPVRLAFAMTINKSQGQSLRVAAINLTNPCFSHGQLYVACSRVGSPRSLYIYTPNKKTKNIVYSIALI